MQFDPTLLMMLAVMAVLVFFMIRNNRKRKKDAEERKTKLVPGVSVMTSFGVYGKLISVDTVENTAELEIAPKTVIKVHVQTLATVIEPKVETIAAAPGHSAFRSARRPALAMAWFSRSISLR